MQASFRNGFCNLNFHLPHFIIPFVYPLKKRDTLNFGFWYWPGSIYEGKPLGRSLLQFFPYVWIVTYFSSTQDDQLIVGRQKTRRRKETETTSKCNVNWHIKPLLESPAKTSPTAEKNDCASSGTGKDTSDSRKTWTECCGNSTSYLVSFHRCSCYKLSSPIYRLTVERNYFEI